VGWRCAMVPPAVGWNVQRFHTFVRGDLPERGRQLKLVVDAGRVIPYVAGTESAQRVADFVEAKAARTPESDNGFLTTAVAAGRIESVPHVRTRRTTTVGLLTRGSPHCCGRALRTGRCG
jgi:hypothetical protein